MFWKMIRQRKRARRKLTLLGIPEPLWVNEMSTGQINRCLSSFGVIRNFKCTSIFLTAFVAVMGGFCAYAADNTTPPYSVEVDEHVASLLDIECHFYQPVPPEVVDTVLRSEVAKLSADKINGRNLMISAWLDDGHESGMASQIYLPDGSKWLYRFAKNGKLVTQKEQAALEIPAVPPGSVINVELTISARRMPDGGICVSGTANLPDGCTAIVSMVNGGESSVTMKDGRFESASFSFQGSPYPPGRYTCDVTVAVARFQPKSVQDIIGSKGERLGGKYIYNTVFGRGVRYEGMFTVD
jgi:hypothetical protein